MSIGRAVRSDLKCAVCNDPKVLALGLCTAHYWQQWRAKQPKKAKPKPTLPLCGVCSAPLRPYNSLRGDWPGTKAKGSTEPLRCTAHANGKSAGTKHFSGHDKMTPKVEHVRIVRRLVQERLEGDDYMLVVDALGIGDDID